MICKSCTYYERSGFTVCDNPNSPNYGEGVHYEDGCSCWAEETENDEVNENR